MTRSITPLLIRSVGVLDVRSGDLIPGQDILLEEGRIRRIVPAGGMEPLGTDILDGSGLVALPGLIDCHAHVHGSFVMGRTRLRDMGWVFNQVARNLRCHLLSGVTTVRDTGGPIHLLRWWQRRVAAGLTVGPRLLCAGPVLTAPQGYPTFSPPLPSLVAAVVGQVKQEIPNAATARRTVATLIRGGSDFIKIAYSSRDYDERLSPLPVPSLQTLRTIIDETHRRGKKVAVHVTWLEDMRRIASLSVDSVEHLIRDGILDDEIVNALADSGTVVVPTASLLMNFLHLDRLAEFFQGPGGRDCLEDVPRARLLRLAEDRQAGKMPARLGDLTFEDAETYARENLAILMENDIPLVLGTDAGAYYSYFGDIAGELRWLVEHGLTPLEAIRSGTLQAAELLGLTGRTGVLQEGTWGDLILVRGDPREDIGIMRFPRWVIAGGRAHQIRESVPIPATCHFPDWDRRE